MKYLPTIALAILLLSTSWTIRQVQGRFTLKGNWYTDLESRTNPLDIQDIRSSNSTTNYCEYYVSDSTITFCEGSTLLSYDQKYFIRGDSIYKCLRPDKNCAYIAMYKIESFSSDTLRLTIHPKYSNRQPNIIWVRLPKGQLGTYDHSWSDTSKYESTLGKVYSDFSRRKRKYYSSRNH